MPYVFMVSYIFYDINGHFVKIAAIRLDGGISLSKNRSHSSSYSRISFKKEENGSKKRIDKTLLPLPGCQFFQIHGSKLKLHPVRHLSQASVLCITHSVFFFGVCKDAFNGLFPLPVKALVLLISEDSCPRIFFIIAGSPALSAFFQTLTLYCCLRPERCFCHTFLCTPQYSGLHRRSRSPG